MNNAVLEIANAEPSGKKAIRRPNFLRLLSQTEREVYDRIPAIIEHMPHSCFDSPDVEDTLFGQDWMTELPKWRYYHEAEDGFVGGSSGKTVLSKEDEVRLFLRYNFARRQLGELIQAQSKRSTLGRARKMIFWFDRVQKTREDLSEANMALVVAMAKRAKVTNVEFSELVCEGNMALLKSIDKFDVARGFKFSTYACRVVLKRFKRVARKTQRYRQLFPAEFDPQLQRSDHAEHEHVRQQENYLEGLQDVLSSNQAGLSYIEQKVVSERFGLRSRGPKRPLTKVGEVCGLSNERVRQIQNVALSKLRTALKHHLLAS